MPLRESVARTLDWTPNSTDRVPARPVVGSAVHAMHGTVLRMQRQQGNRYVAEVMRRARDEDRDGDLYIHRDLLDDFGDEVSNLGAAAVAGVQQAGSAIAEQADAIQENVSSAVGAAGSAVASGVDAVGEGVSSAVGAVGSAVQGGAAAIGNAVGGAAQAVGSAPAALGEQASGIIDWIQSEAGKLALRAAQALARKFGGDVVVSPDGGIDILFPDIEIAEIEDETFVLPLGLPTKPLFEAPFEVGTFIINTSVGSVIGDPAVTIAAGPVRLQHVKLHLDPGGDDYAGTGQLFVGSEVVGSGEHATEARVQAVGVLPFEVPIPIEASAAVGIRDILRIAGRESVQETVRVGYSGGRFKVDALTDVKLGALAQLDNEAFVRVEIEGLEVCSVIWPFSSKRLGDAAVQITLPISVASGGDGIVGRIGEPKTAPIPVDAIQTSLKNSRPPTHCISLAELGPFLCKLGKLPPNLCAVVGVAPDTPGPTPAKDGSGRIGDIVTPPGEGFRTAPEFDRPEADGPGNVVSVIDVKFVQPPVDRSGGSKRDSVASGVALGPFSQPGGRAVQPFGESFFEPAFVNTSFSFAGGVCTIVSTLNVVCPWGTNAGGRDDIVSGTSPLVTSANWPAIKSDLEPLPSSPFKSPRTHFYSKQLVERHEQFHGTDDLSFVKSLGLGIVNATLQAGTVSQATAAADVAALVNRARKDLILGADQFYKGGGTSHNTFAGEIRAYGDGRPHYQALANAVEAHGKTLPP